MEFYTYIYYDPSRDNEPIYVGKGHDNRAWDHLTRTKRHPFVQRLQFMKKNGVKPIIGIYAGYDEEFALFLEEELIAKFGRKDLGLGPLLNLTNGGDGVSNPSSDVRKKIGAANKGKKRSPETIDKIRKNGFRPSFKGMNHSDKTRNKISDANTGKVRSQEFKDNLSAIHKGKVAWNKGIPATDEHKLKNSEANKGRKDSAETKQRKSAATKGKTKSASHRSAISQTLLNKPKFMCVHCNRLLAESNYNKWHNDNCKLKDKENK